MSTNAMPNNIEKEMYDIHVRKSVSIHSQLTFHDFKSV